MGGIAVDGLITGLDTSSMIEQLLNLERAPQRQLQAKQSSLQRSVAAYTELNAKFKAVADAAAALNNPDDWALRTASSSNDQILTAKVTGTPAPGTLTLNITSMAATHAIVSDNTVAGTDTVVADGSDFMVNGVLIEAANYGDGTLAEVAAAINAADAGVTATTVQVSPGNYRLQITAEDSGADFEFVLEDDKGKKNHALSGVLGDFGIVTQGADAQATVGTGPSAYQVTSPSNTFSDVIPGLAFTAVGTGTATITVGNDGEALADKVEALATAMHEAQKFVDDNNGYNAETRKRGIFMGQSMPGRLRTDMWNALIDPVEGAPVVGKNVGIETDRYGAVSFDRSKFLAAYADDAEAVENFFGVNGAGTADDGAAERIRLVTEEATRQSTGRIASFISGREDQIRGLDDQIAQWDVRLDLREANLRRQFANLETMMGRMQQQSAWLAGQLSSLR